MSVAKRSQWKLNLWKKEQEVSEKSSEWPFDRGSHHAIEVYNISIAMKAPGFKNCLFFSNYYESA